MLQFCKIKKHARTSVSIKLTGLSAACDFNSEMMDAAILFSLFLICNNFFGMGQKCVMFYCSPAVELFNFYVATYLSCKNISCGCSACRDKIVVEQKFVKKNNN